jgi:hypothetical protein
MKMEEIPVPSLPSPSRLHWALESREGEHREGAVDSVVRGWGTSGD